MKFFLDTEFIDDGKTIEPISIAVVTEDGHEFYIELEFDEDKARSIPFLVEHVLPHLKAHPDARIRRDTSPGKLLQMFVEQHADARGVEFWAYFADYDWIVIAQLFGPMVDLPKGFPRLCMDLQQHWLTLGRPNIKPLKPANAHDALADALWNKRFYEAMQT